MSATPLRAIPLSPPYLSQQLRRFIPLVVVIALHVVFFYTLQSGLLHRAAKTALPKEIYVRLISEEPAPQPRPQPVEPKTVPVVKSIPRPAPKPVVKHETSQAISEPTPPSPPQPPQPPTEAAPPAPPAPATPAQPAQPKIVSGASYISAPPPDYPAVDRRMGNEGTVVLRIWIDEKGHPTKAEVQKSSVSDRMNQAAVDKVMRRWLFKPYMEDGRAIPVSVLVPINFTLSN